MNCKNCFYSLNGFEKYCPNCGSKITSISSEVINSGNFSKLTENTRVASIVFGIISVVGVSFFIFAPISLILAIVGLCLAIKANRNTAGIIINAIGLIISFIITAFFLLALYFVIIGIDKLPDFFDGYIPENIIVEENRF